MKTTGVRHEAQIKEQAASMRRDGIAVKVIARTLSVAPWTVWFWLRGIKLSREQRTSIGANARARGCQSFLESVARRHLAARGDADKMWEINRSDPLFVAGIGLYWGEGTKRGRCPSLELC